MRSAARMIERTITYSGTLHVPPPPSCFGFMTLPPSQSEPSRRCTNSRALRPNFKRRLIDCLGDLHRTPGAFGKVADRDPVATAPGRGSHHDGVAISDEDDELSRHPCVHRPALTLAGI
jgi:hypothetical protein